MTDERPDPDKLLEKMQRAEAKARGGRLKIFFGALTSCASDSMA